MKKFFSIRSDEYEFNIYDLTAFVTMMNVIFIIMGFWWAPILGLINCAICCITNIRNHAYINAYITQFSLIVLNVYFLKMF